MTKQLLAALLVAAMALSVTAADMAEGVVRKVSKDTGKVTLRHGEIKNLDMPPMTMVFQVKDPTMLDGLEPGDKVLYPKDEGYDIRLTGMSMRVMKRQHVIARVHD